MDVYGLVESPSGQSSVRGRRSRNARREGGEDETEDLDYPVSGINL